LRGNWQKKEQANSNNNRQKSIVSDVIYVVQKQGKSLK
jgi:hypothetical protein